MGKNKFRAFFFFFPFGVCVHMEPNPCPLKPICLHPIRCTVSVLARSFWYVICMGELDLAWGLARRSLRTTLTGVFQSFPCNEMF